MESSDRGKHLDLLVIRALNPPKLVVKAAEINHGGKISHVSCRERIAGLVNTAGRNSEVDVDLEGQKKL